MSTKKRYNLTVNVNTLQELTQGQEKTHVDVSVYAIQTARTQTQFTDFNNTAYGYSSTDNLSDSGSAFILFGLDASDNQFTFRSCVYNAVCNLIGTTNGRSSMCIVIPVVINPSTTDIKKKVDMTLLVDGIISGLRDAMKDSKAVVKTNTQTLYFVVPLSMKEALAAAIAQVE